MLILLYGPDTFRSRQKRNELVAAYRNKYASGLSESSFSDADFLLRDFEEHARGQGLFSAKRLIVLSNVSQNKSALHDLEARMKQNDLAASRDVFLVVWEDRDLQKVKEAEFLLKAASMAQVFPLLQGSGYRAWLSKTEKDSGATFVPAARELFAQWHEGDSWRSIADMQKLHAYANGKTIRIEDVKKLCLPPREQSIFVTMDLLFSRKPAEAFAAIWDHLQAGEEPLYLLSMLSYQLRLIALVREKLDAGETSFSIPGVHPYALRKTTPLARSIPREKLGKLFGMLFSSDAAIKQGTADSALCLEMVAYEIACA